MLGVILVTLLSFAEDKFQYMVRASYIEIYNEEIRDLVRTAKGGMQANAHLLSRLSWSQLIVMCLSTALWALLSQLSKEFEKKLELKESPDKGVYVKDLIQFVAKGVSELNNVMKARGGREAAGAGWLWKCAVYSGV